MLKDLRGANIIGMLLDILGAVILVTYALIVGPLGVLRGPIAFERGIWYFWVLVPQGLMARSVRAAIDWRFGHFDAAIAQMEGLVGANEEYYKARPTSRPRRRVLEDFYTLLARAYLHAGHIDDAMLVVIRAKKSMGIDRLGGLAELDAKTAHLVRAGLAAGRLLDGGGLATMFVKSTPTPHLPESTPQNPAAALPHANRRPDAANHRNNRRQGAVKEPNGSGGQAEVDAASGQLNLRPEAKVVPFPGPEAK